MTFEGQLPAEGCLSVSPRLTLSPVFLGFIKDVISFLSLESRCPALLSPLLAPYAHSVALASVLWAASFPLCSHSPKLDIRPSYLDQSRGLLISVPVPWLCSFSSLFTVKLGPSP